jgi:hypothetical protein
VGSAPGPLLVDHLDAVISTVVIQTRYYNALAIAAFIAIPVFGILGMSLTVFINPEIARYTSNYVLNFQLLQGLKHVVFATTLLCVMTLWFLTCFFLVRAKQRSIFWVPLAIFGPFGLIILVALRSGDQTTRSAYQKFVAKLWLPVRVVYEFCLFNVAWMLAYYLVDLKRDLIILHQSIIRGVPIQTIVDEQQASGGMWAFSEGMETIFLIVLFYLLWPICFNAVAWLIGTRSAIPSG